MHFLKKSVETYCQITIPLPPKKGFTTFLSTQQSEWSFPQIRAYAEGHLLFPLK